MDFDLTDEQQATAEVATKLLGDKSTPDALRALELADDSRFDRSLWAAMADAGLLGIAVPEAHGGAGLGMLELALVLQEVGRHTAAVPALASLAFAGLPIARFGSDVQQAALLPGLAAGTSVLTAALVEPLGDPLQPTTVAEPDGDGFRLSGTKTNVLAGMLAEHFHQQAERLEVVLGAEHLDGARVGNG
jgi:alkylation response protein AidB-like acyl-CoA dehydrogenase